MDFNLKDIGEEPVATFFLNLILLITPGMLLIFYFHRDIFLTLDILKLILLSISFIAPFIIVNIIFVIFVDFKRNISKAGDTFMYFSLGLWAAAFSFFVSFLISYILKLSFEFTFFEIIFLDFCCLIVLYFLIRGAEKSSSPPR